MSVEETQGFNTRLSLENLVTVALEAADDEFTDLFRVFDQNDRLAALKLLGGEVALRQHRNLGGSGEIDYKARAAADLALHFNMPTRLLNDSDHRAEAQPGSFATLFGGEEGLEDLRPDIRAHSTSVVADAQGEILAGRNLVDLGRDGGFKGFVRGFDDNAPALGHRVARIDDEVEQYLLELTRIRLDGPGGAIEQGHEFDIFSNQSPEHAIHVRDQVVQVKDSRLQDLSPTKGQQLMSEPGGAFRRFEDLLCIGASRMLGSQLLEQEVAIAGNCGQQIVEVVGDSAGHATDRFHLLGLLQFLFGLAQGFAGFDLLGDVPRDQHRHYLRARGTIRPHGRLQQPVPTVSMQRAK